MHKRFLGPAAPLMRPKEISQQQKKAICAGKRHCFSKSATNLGRGSLRHKGTFLMRGSYNCRNVFHGGRFTKTMHTMQDKNKWDYTRCLVVHEKKDVLENYEYCGWKIPIIIFASLLQTPSCMVVIKACWERCSCVGGVDRRLTPVPIGQMTNMVMVTVAIALQIGKDWLPWCGEDARQLTFQLRTEARNLL